MPTFEYRCPSCGAITEEYRHYSRADDAPPTCAPCSMVMERKITGGSATVLRGGTGAGRKGHLPR